jgi:hypothetical protein
MITIPTGTRAASALSSSLTASWTTPRKSSLDALDRIHLADGKQPRLTPAQYPSGLYPGHSVDMPAEPDRLGLAGQQMRNRHHDHLGADSASLDGSLDWYLRVRARHAQAYQPQLWLGVSNRGPMTASGIYQVIARRGRQCGIDVFPHRFRHHFSHTWLDRAVPRATS